MCVILYKPKKVHLPDEEILKNCFLNNRDGAGYTFTYKNNVIVKKGFLTFNEFITNLRKDYKAYKLDNKNLILHFRIGTSGGITKEKTQPFKITNNIKELNKLYIKNKKASIVHNGIFNEFTYNEKNSDTQNYIKDFLQPLLNSNMREQQKDTLIDNSLHFSKLAILYKNDIVSLYGDFIRYKGIYYSNNSFNNYSDKKGSTKYNFINHKRELLTRYNNNYFDKENNNSIWYYHYNNKGELVYNYDYE